MLEAKWQHLPSTLHGDALLNLTGDVCCHQKMDRSADNEFQLHT